jgi:DNA polymerase-1
MNEQATKARRANQTSVPDGEAAPVAKGSKVYLIDGSGYIFRAFHALPPLTRPSDGLPVGAVHGFCQMLWKLMAETKASEEPTHIAVVFDAGAQTFRNEIYEDYKANRPPPPEELVPQFPLIRDAVKAFNVACIEEEGFEADDIIATYARQIAEAGGEVVIVSSDKDLMQLVGPGIEMLDTMKNRRLGPDEVVEKFGVGPDRVVDVQALAGDSVDNVPGVPGIGVKTAAQLITEYGDLDTLLERAEEIKQPKRREKLIEFAEQARVSRELVKLKDDVPLPIKTEQLGVHTPDPETVLGFLQEMEFNTLTRRIAEALGAEIPQSLPKSVGSSVKTTAKGKAGDGKAKAGNGVHSPDAVAEHNAELARTAPFDRSAYETVTTLEDLERWIGAAREQRFFAFDTETTSLNAMQADLVGFSLATAPGKACYVPVGHVADEGGLALDDNGGLDQLALRDVLERLKPLLEDRGVLKIGQNLKYDMLVLKRYGVRLAPLDDTMLMSYALDGGKGGHGMDDLAQRHLGHTCISFKQVIAHAPGKKAADKSFAGVPIEKAAEYAAEDADVTLRLWMVLKARLVAEHMVTVYETLERRLVPVIVDMEHAGIRVERSVLARLSATFAQRAAEYEDTVYELAGKQFNLGSPRQLGELLFDDLKLPGGKKTKSGQWETRANLLDDLAANPDLPEDARRLIETMLQWRQLTKLRSTYTDALPGHIHPDTGRIHTSYSLAATTTGRLASTDPNLQNIPIRTKEGREIRTAFIAEKGNKLISADYSQIELRVLAHMADIPQRPRHPRDDGLGNVRRADRGHAGGSAPPRQGDQLRHHLRHLGVRPRQSALDPARGSRRLHQDLFRALPRHQGLHGAHQEVREGQRLRRDDLRAQGALPGHQHEEPLGARLLRARGDQRADPGLGRRHHPPRHDPDAEGSRRGRPRRRPHAASGSRRTDLRGAREKRRQDARPRSRRDGRRDGTDPQARRAAQGRRRGGGQLGRRALILLTARTA